MNSAFAGAGRRLFPSGLRSCFSALLALLVLSLPILADELTLKDGHKISGTIVGFENGMFRLETEYGFELVRKDKVASIRITESAGKDANPKAETNKIPADHSTAVSGHAEPVSNSGALPPAESKPSPPPVSHVVNEPLPPHIEQHEEGTNYVNDTFRFAMFKPPGWKIYEELPHGKVSAIVAMASEDEQTLLFVDRQLWSGEPNLKNDIVEANLRQIYEDYKKLSETDTQVDGRAAIRRNFSGLMDGVEWHGIAVRVAQGPAVFGIIEMTSSEGYQFQEAVFNKIVKSFHFLSAESGPNSMPTHNAGVRE